MRVILDGNEAAASVAYRCNEICAIFPITPASPMAELADEWSAKKRPNVYGSVPAVIEMQSEAGAAGALHGALQGGALSTTFTASQGLLLMIPDMVKIAGELTPAVFHVAARSLAAQGLSIFGDHQDVMAVRQTGFALLASSSVQEAHDLAAVAQAATLRARVPFVHFFDGFRTSHEVNTVELLSDEDLRSLVPEELVRAHRARALSPEHAFIRGTSQNPDVYFQARETVNPFDARVPGLVQEAMDALAARIGRRYHLVDYTGDPEADRVAVAMGSGAETLSETVAHLCRQGEKVGVLTLHLYRPFPAEALLSALPDSVRRVAVLDRTKEPGSFGEPLFLDVLSALAEGHASGSPGVMPEVIGGRYGLSSKELSPAMAAGLFAELARAEPRRRFTVGIDDDVSGTSIPYDASLDIEAPETLRAVFFGLGSDGTVGANKNTIKILGASGRFAQGYFVYDSKKSGSETVSHLRFGPTSIRAPYLVEQAGFVGCHHLGLLGHDEVLGRAAPGATLLLNCPQPADQVWDTLARPVQQQIAEKRITVYVIDANRIARELGLAERVNTRSTSAGRSTRRWPPALPSASRPTPARSVDGSHHDVPRPRAEEPARRLGLAALPHLRRSAPPGRGRRGGGGAALALRRRARPRSRARRGTFRGRNRQLRRVAQLFPRGARRRSWPAPLPRLARTGRCGGRDPGDRKPQRLHPGRLDEPRPPDARRRRSGHRAQSLRLAPRPRHLRARGRRTPCRDPRPRQVGCRGASGGQDEPVLQLDRGDGRRFVGAGADGLVLFNRFLHPDVDPEALTVVPGIGLSAPTDARLPRAWVALLCRRLEVSLAASTGVEHPEDVVAYLLAGADVVMSTSALLRHGPEHASHLVDGLSAWMSRKGFQRLEELRGLLALPADVDRAAGERSDYVRAMWTANATTRGPW